MTRVVAVVGDSPYRTWETRENGTNWYGRVLIGDTESDGQMYPVICQHGGSMWFCEPCAQAFIEHERKAGAVIA